MKTRSTAKWIASAMAAGTITFASGGDILSVGLGVPTAFAQTAKPDAKPADKPATTPAADKPAGEKPAAKPAAKPAKGAADATKPDAKALNEAKARYADGEKKFKAGDTAGALADFEAADQIKPTPQAARYIGLCQDNLQHYPEAVTAYERFLANVPPKMTAQGDEIKKRVEAIKAMPAKLHLDSDPKGATVTIDGKAASGVTPVDVDVPPGHHTLVFSIEGHEDQTKDLDVTYAAKQDVTVTLPAKAAPPPPPVAVVAPPPAEAPPPPPPPPPPQPRSKLPAFITGGLAVAAAGVGTVFGVMALSDKSDFDKNPTSSKADDGENHALIADMAFGVAITLGVTSAVLFLSNDDQPAAAASNAPRASVASNAHRAEKATITITPTPIITAHGGGAGALVRF